MKKSYIIIWLFFVIGCLPLNAQTWKNYGNGLDYPVNTICSYNNKIYVGSGGIFSWNGTSWDDNSDGMLTVMDVYTLAVYNGSLFSGGFFTVLTPDQNWYNNAARFYNGNWTTCGSGLDNDGWGPSGDVNFLLVYNGHLYAGGNFGSAGGTPLSPQETPYIAKFDGSTWLSAGSGMNDRITDLCIYNNDLIASGYFTEAGGVPANRIAKWNGNTWSALGSGMDYKVTALAVYKGELYAGGQFNTAGGTTATGIAKWNGQSWSKVGNGIQGGGQIYTLAVYNNELYAGGTFTSASANAGDYIMRWDGAQWKSVGSGTDGNVVCIYPNGSDLIIGGSFSTAGGISAHNISLFTTITDVGETVTFPKEFSLEQNYPNPFNPGTKITWHVPNKSHVQIKILDLLGNEIKTLVDEEKPAGQYEITWIANNLSSGVYFYQLKSANLVQTKKMILMK